MYEYIWVRPRPPHSHKMWIEVSSSVSRFLQVGLLLSPIIYKCLLKVLCPVSRPITTLDFVLWKDSNWAPVARSGPEINSSSCRCTTRTTPQCQMLVFHPAFHLSSYILPRDPQESLRSNKQLNRTTPCELVSDFISSQVRVRVIWFVWWEVEDRLSSLQNVWALNMLDLREDNHWHCAYMGTAVAQWLRCCATNRKVAASIPAGVIGSVHWHKTLPMHYGPGVEASNRNEYQEHFLGVKAADA